MALGAAVFFTVDLAFLGANLTKVAHGGWFPLSVGVAVFTVLSTWKRGSDKVHAARIEEEGSLRSFVEELRAMEPPPVRVPGTAVYLNARRETTPLALRAGVEHNRVDPRGGRDHLDRDDRKRPTCRSPNGWSSTTSATTTTASCHLTARFGFQDTPDVPRLLALAAETGLECEVDVEGAVYFLSQVTVTPTAAPGMAALAQAPLRGDVPQRRQPGRLLPPARATAPSRSARRSSSDSARAQSWSGGAKR